MNTMDAVLVDFVLELKYATEESTRKQIKALFVSVEQREPSPKQDLLKWFKKNYEFDGSDTWYFKGAALLN